MFSHCYQSGNPIELYNGHDKTLFSKWKFSGRNSKIYDSTLKSYMHILDIGTLSKMELPKAQRGIAKSLGIFQSYIVFQLYLFTSKQFSIEISISDTTRTKRRLIFSSNNSDLVFNQLHCRIPILNFPIGKWVNFSIDILSFVSECFKDLTFRSIDYICLSMSGKVREIFTMRSPLSTLEGNSDAFASPVPDRFAVGQSENINMNCNRVISQIYIENQMNMVGSSEDKKGFTFGKMKQSAKPTRMSNIGNMIMNSGNVSKRELNNQREFINVSNNNVNNINSRSSEFENKNRYKFFNKEEYTKSLNDNKSVANHVKRSLNVMNNNNINNSKWDSTSIDLNLNFDNRESAVNIMNQISTIKNENNDDKSDYEIPSKDFSPQNVNTENANNNEGNNKKKIIEAILEDSSHYIFPRENSDLNDNNIVGISNEDENRPFSPPITKM